MNIFKRISVPLVPFILSFMTYSPGVMANDEGFLLGDKLPSISAANQNNVTVDTATYLGNGKVSIIQVCEWFCVPCYVATGHIIGTLSDYLNNPATIGQLLTGVIPAGVIQERFVDSPTEPVFIGTDYSALSVRNMTLEFRSLFFGLDTPVKDPFNPISALVDTSQINYISLQAEDFSFIAAGFIPSDEYSAKIYQTLYYMNHPNPIILHDSGQSNGPISSFMNGAGISELPTFFITDSDGRLLARTSGYSILGTQEMSDKKFQKEVNNTQLIKLANEKGTQSVTVLDAVNSAIDFIKNANLAKNETEKGKKAPYSAMTKQQLLTLLNQAKADPDNAKPLIISVLHTLDLEVGDLSGSEFGVSIAPVVFGLVRSLENYN